MRTDPEEDEGISLRTGPDDEEGDWEDENENDRESENKDKNDNKDVFKSIPFKSGDISMIK